HPQHSIYSFDISQHTSPSSISTLSLHDALPIFKEQRFFAIHFIYYNTNSIENTSMPFSFLNRFSSLKPQAAYTFLARRFPTLTLDRKSTRLNSSHVSISYAVFCLKKKTPTTIQR